MWFGFTNKEDLTYSAVEVGYIRAQVIGPNSITLLLAEPQGNAESSKLLAFQVVWHAMKGNVVGDVTPSFPLRDWKFLGKAVKAFWLVIHLTLLAFSSFCSVHLEQSCMLSNPYVKCVLVKPTSTSGHFSMVHTKPSRLRSDDLDHRATVQRLPNSREAAVCGRVTICRLLNRRNAIVTSSWLHLCTLLLLFGFH